MAIPKMMRYIALICVLFVTRVDMGHNKEAPANREYRSLLNLLGISIGGSANVKTAVSSKTTASSKTTTDGSLLSGLVSEVEELIPAVLDWTSFLTTFGKSYDTPEEKKLREFIYNVNKDFIQGHNELFSTGEKNFQLGVNEFSDLTQAEFSSILAGEWGEPEEPEVQGTEQDPNADRGHHEHQVNDTTDFDNLPLAVDWRTKGYVTDIKNQGRCGSCWAFASVAVLEAQLYNLTGSLVPLSEQNLIDCSSTFGNGGCRGGATVNAYKYVRANGLDTEEDYPYEGKTQASCLYNASDNAVSVGQYVTIKSKNETVFQQAVATVGPIAVAVNSDLRSFQFYKSGVYDDLNCTNKINHAVTIVGYGTANGNDYWLIKNSWGTSWGDKGYMYLFRNNNTCGVANQASYVILN